MATVIYCDTCLKDNEQEEAIVRLDLRIKNPDSSSPYKNGVFDIVEDLCERHFMEFVKKEYSEISRRYLISKLEKGV